MRKSSLRPLHRVRTGVVALTLLAVACGGAAAPTATPTARAAPTPTSASAAPATPVPVAGQATATPTRPTPTTAPLVTASRGKIIYAKPVDMGRTNTVQPTGGAGGPDNPFISSLNAGLTSITLDGTLIPWAGKRWEFSQDQKTLTLTIRDDVVFHDGTKATVDDWVFRFNDLYLNPIQPGAAKPTGRQPVAEKVEKVGPDSFRIVWPSPNSWFLEEILKTEQSGGLSIYPKDYIQRVGFDEFYKNPVGAGPYKLALRRAADVVILEAHEQFFNGPPPVKSIEVRIAPEDSTRIAMFLTGEADIAESIAPQYLPQVERMAGAKVLGVRSGQEVVIHFLAMFEKIPDTDLPNPFRDVRVRRAFAHAVDKKAIVERIAGKAGVAVKGPFSSFHTGADEANITEYEYNPEKAKQLLREANYPFTTPFNVYSYQASAPAPLAVEAFVNYLKEVGVNAVFTNLEVTALIRRWANRTAYPMTFIRSWNVHLDPLNHHFGYLDTRANGFGSTLDGFASDPKLDALAAEADRTAEPKAHAEAVKKYYRYLHEQAYVIDLYAIVDNHAIGKRVDWRYPPGLPSRFDLITWRQ